MPAPASRRTIVARGFVAVVTTCALSAQSGPRWTTPTPAEVDAVFPDVDALYVDASSLAGIGISGSSDCGHTRGAPEGTWLRRHDGSRQDRDRRHSQERRRSHGDAAHRARCASGRREDRPALRQHRRHEERGRTIYPRDARVRPRSPHGRLDRNRAAHGRTSRPLERHAHDGGTTSGRRTRRRDGRC